MSTMRVANQQDLIYKRGQAGVMKTRVTIIFDNSDRSQSPTGYEQCKQIMVTRQLLARQWLIAQIAIPNVSKYLLNGHKARQGLIQTLFQSVQLNINDPDFFNYARTDHEDKHLCYAVLLVSATFQCLDSQYASSRGMGTETFEECEV
ncbi:hypothetical protein M378DRAFT_14879 [Amanita muscaria Koide BX008]|uniref:Uncharacterized protein n=1 Tax=Amanita muscaria (strain Koide BX008) TaxID=946122 RepID=A0A0C2WDC0_AMAMK|nr:hypothetical protein M378DRAFT_14879 [Amanita muscaria Koide BX008]